MKIFSISLYSLIDWTYRKYLILTVNMGLWWRILLNFFAVIWMFGQYQIWFTLTEETILLHLNNNLWNHLDELFLVFINDFFSWHHVRLFILRYFPQVVWGKNLSKVDGGKNSHVGGWWYEKIAPTICTLISLIF